jgi:indolepyruvate ferredoxin oxidoreductase beta subunit
MHLKSIILAAVGGQGGGVLSEWVVTAAHRAGYQAQSISMPGMAQRGGATSLYLEIAIPEDARDTAPVVFSQYAFPRGVDVVLSQEYLELGRVLQAGYTHGGSTVVGSSHRLFAVTEKMPLWGGRTEQEALTELGHAFSGNFVVFDALDLARQRGLDELAVNAILLGALAASRALPISTEQYRQAIQQTAIAVQPNQKAFDVGFAFVDSGGHLQQRDKKDLNASELAQTNRGKLRPAERDGYQRLVDEARSTCPAELQDVLVEALFQLCDYQDAAYARRLLDETSVVLRLESGPPYELTRHFIRHLTPLLTYEDVIRVADFKTDPGRFEKIRRDFNVKHGDVYVLHDFFDPDMEELYGILPRSFVDRFVKPRDYQADESPPSAVPFKANVHNLVGAFPMWFLKRWRPRRTSSFRYHHEMQFVDTYLGWVKEFTAADYQLGCLAARTGQMVKGYGRVRRRTRWATRRFVDDILRPTMELEKPHVEAAGFSLTLVLGEESRRLLGVDERGPHLALALKERVFAAYRKDGYAAALAEARGAVGAPVAAPR